jgi:hypothetical protein
MVGFDAQEERSGNLEFLIFREDRPYLFSEVSSSPNPGAIRPVKIRVAVV